MHMNKSDKDELIRIKIIKIFNKLENRAFDLLPSNLIIKEFLDSINSIKRK